MADESWMKEKENAELSIHGALLGQTQLYKTDNDAGVNCGNIIIPSQQVGRKPTKIVEGET